MPFSYEKQGVYKTNSYLVWEDEDAVIIDPPLDMDTMLQAIESRRLTLQAVLCTHLHYDHAIGCAKWQKKFNLNVYASSAEIANKESMLKRSFIRIGVDVEPFDVTPLPDGPCKWGKVEAVSIFVRGHSPCGICYYFNKQGILMTGDSLFMGEDPRLDLPESCPEFLYPDLQKKIMVLPSLTMVLPGHGEPTTIGDEYERIVFA